MNLEFGDIVLIAFPFSDSSEFKKRPALIISDTKDNDFICCRITSQKYSSKYDMDLKGWKKSGLLTPSTIRVHKIAALSKKLIDRKIGNINEDEIKEIKTILKNLFLI